MRLASVKDLFIKTGYCLLAAAIALLLHVWDKSLGESFDDFLGDWRIVYGSPRAQAQRPDIAVVLITEETLLHYESRSPVNRALLAELIRAIDAAMPKAIALDFIFDRRTSDDARLLEAIKQARAPVFLGAIDSRAEALPENYVWQRAFLQSADRPYGHVMLERYKDTPASNGNAIRRVAAPLPAEPGQEQNAIPAFTDVIAWQAGAPHKTANSAIAWLREPLNDDLFATLRIPAHLPADIRNAMENVFPQSWGDVLKDRIVLVGAAMTDRDQHFTPLSVQDGKAIPGVFIQAQALAQRLDGNRDTQIWPYWLIALALFFISLASFRCHLWLENEKEKHIPLSPLKVFRRATGQSGFLFGKILKTLSPLKKIVGLLGFILIGLASFFAFSWFQVDIRSSALVTAWFLGALGPKILLSLRLIKPGSL